MMKEYKEAFDWSIGFAKIVKDLKEIPWRREFVGTSGGYRFYKTRHGNFAIKDENNPTE